MADIEKIVLPSGNEYDIKDAVARQMTLIAVYTPATENLEIIFTTAASADDTEY